MPFGQPIEQIAYSANDARTLAEQHSRLLGSAPFFLIEIIESGSVIPRGRRYGFHHAGLLVDDLEPAVAASASRDFPEVSRATLRSINAELAMVDTTSAFGNFTELHQPVPGLTKFSDEVRKTPIGFTSDEPVRTPEFI